MKGKLAACVAFTAASAGIGIYGTSRQVECFDGIEKNYGVNDVKQLPERVIDDSGCLSILNTLGLLGVAGGLASGVGVVTIDAVRRRQETLAALESFISTPVE